MIAIWVEKLWQMVTFDIVGEDPTYLFPLASDNTRGQSSSQWCQSIKGIFKKHAGVACSPKTLRQSFITFMRSHPDCDSRLIESCAKAMKHLTSTSASDNYDKEGE